MKIISFFPVLIVLLMALNFTACEKSSMESYTDLPETAVVEETETAQSVCGLIIQSASAGSCCSTSATKREVHVNLATYSYNVYCQNGCQYQFLNITDGSWWPIVFSSNQQASTFCLPSGKQYRLTVKSNAHSSAPKNVTLNTCMPY